MKAAGAYPLYFFSIAVTFRCVIHRNLKKQKDIHRKSVFIHTLKIKNVDNFTYFLKLCGHFPDFYDSQ